ncbi:MAG TPA: hypothetical protein EYP43_03965 [Thermoplasmata archaeon]|nr:hypothetical protein [Thermoplasmata archaeon]
MKEMAMFALLVLLLVATSSAGEEVSREFDLEGGEYEEFRLDVQANDTVTLDVSFSVEDPDENSTSAIDVYLIALDQFDEYDRNESFDPVRAWEGRAGLNTFHKFDEAMTVYLVIDNWDNNRSTDAEPGRNGTITVNLTYNITSPEPPTLPTSDGGGNSNEGFGTFLILATIVLVVFAIIGLWMRRRGSGEEGEDTGQEQEEEEDFFGRIRIG